MEKLIANNYIDFLNEAGDSLTDTAKYTLKITALKDKIKNNFDKANQSQAKAQELLQKGQADKASIETLKYRKAIAATNLAQIDYKLFIKTEALKKQAEAEKAKK
jgi:hypothetical protein